MKIKDLKEILNQYDENTEVEVLVNGYCPSCDESIEMTIPDLCCYNVWYNPQRKAVVIGGFERV